MEVSYVLDHWLGVSDSTLLLIINKMPTSWWGRQNAAPLKFDPKKSEAAFLAVFQTSRNADLG